MFELGRLQLPPGNCYLPDYAILLSSFLPQSVWQDHVMLACCWLLLLKWRQLQRQASAAGLLGYAHTPLHKGHMFDRFQWLYEHSSLVSFVPLLLFLVACGA